MAVPWRVTRDVLATRSPLGHRWHSLRLDPPSAHRASFRAGPAVCHQPPVTYSQLAAQDLVCVRVCVCLRVYVRLLKKDHTLYRQTRENYLVFQVPGRT